VVAARRPATRQWEDSMTSLDKSILTRFAPDGALFIGHAVPAPGIVVPQAFAD
jgi:hypothetical protein